MSKKNNFIFIFVIIFLLAASMLVKHPFNFTPIIAMSIFGGCYLRKKIAVLIPLSAMVIGDYFIGFYDWKLMAFVYIGVAVSFYIGWALKKRFKWQNVIYASLLSSVIFFILTNFSVWFFSGWYPRTLAGLSDCFRMALPFFRNSLIGDFIYTGVIFGSYELVCRILSRQNIIKQMTN